MRIHTRNRDDNPFAGSSQSDKVVRSNLVVAGLGKVCEKAWLTFLVISAVLIGAGMIAGFITFVTIGALRVRHPEAEYQIQTGQIFWSGFAICIIIFFLGTVWAKSYDQPNRSISKRRES